MSKPKSHLCEQTENIYRCGVCFKHFSNEQLCYSHMISHSSNDTQSHLVATDTRGPQKTLSHIRSEKKSQKEHESIKCDCCEKYFPNILKLKRHLQQRRTGAEFQCSVCNLICTKWSQFTTHMRIHSNHRPFKCDLCMKAFKRKTHLVQHRKLHTGEKPFKCSLCKAAFADKCNLNRHLKLHPKQSNKTFRKFRCRRSRVPVVQNPVIHVEEKGSEETNDEGLHFSGNVPRFDKIEETKALEGFDEREQVSSGKEQLLEACTALVNLNKDLFKKEETGETAIASTDSENMIILTKEDRTDKAYMRIVDILLVLSVPCDDLKSKSCIPVRTDDADLLHRKPDDDDAPISHKSEDSYVLLSQEADEHDVMMSLETNDYLSGRTGSDTRDMNRILMSKTNQRFEVIVNSGKVMAPVCDIKKVKDISAVESGKYTSGFKGHSTMQTITVVKDDMISPCVIVAKENTENVHGQSVNHDLLSISGAGSRLDNPQVSVPVECSGSHGSGLTLDTLQELVPRDGVDSKDACLESGQVPSSQVSVGFSQISKKDNMDTGSQVTEAKGRRHVSITKESSKKHQKTVVSMTAIGRDKLELDSGQTLANCDHRHSKQPVKCNVFFECHFCGKKMKTASALKYHVRIHTKHKAITCRICKKDFYKPSVYEVHMRSHTGLKPYFCVICNRKYRDCSSLRSHMKLHTGLNVFSCSVCNKVFSKRTELISHFKIHTGDKPYLCQMCPKTFRTQHSLSRHVLCHTGDKPYTCQYCDLGFRDTSNRKKHMRKHHNLNS
ncbi:zinc finger protein 845-like [Haliotis asinina]|uniref:zinc finger protein 845-like n=1 Tax=Haliotis asinina TaxID=109174 RepID=UPI003531FA83